MTPSTSRPYLIDPGVFIAIERGVLTEDDLIAALGGAAGSPGVMAAIGVAELLMGVHGANSESRRLQRERYVEQVLARLPIVPFDEPAARVYGRLIMDLRRVGLTVGSHDLQMAATALAYGYGVVTLNLKDFAKVPELDVRAVLPGMSDGGAAQNPGPLPGRGQ